MAHKKSGILLLLGAIAGAITALFFSTNKEGETREVVQKKMRQLKTKLAEVKEKDVIKQIFGEKTDEVVKLFRETKDSLVSKLAKVKGSLDQIEKQKYLDVVSEVVADLKQNSKVTAGQLTKMKTYLENDYRKLAGKKVVKKAD